MKITSFKNGGARYSPTEYLKMVYHTTTVVGAIGKKGYGRNLEYRVYYVCKDMVVSQRSPIANNAIENPNTDTVFVLMECFSDLKLATTFVKEHFKSVTSLKTAVFHLYVKMLHQLG